MQKTKPQTIEERVSTLEVEMLYTNNRIIEALSSIKTTLKEQDVRFVRLEKRLDNMEQQLGHVQSTIDTLAVKLDDVRAVATNMQEAKLNEMD